MSDEDVEEVLTQASTQNPPPSLQSIFRKIDCHNTGYRYYSKFPLLCSTIATRYKNFRSQTSNLERIESLLIAALNETPPPSISELARRIKCKRGTLDGLFPELVSKIINQRKGFLISSSEMSSSEKKIQKIAKEVEEYDYFITEKNEMNFLRKLYLHSLKSLIEE
jgi:DNA-binding transcriptional regulator YhcF (GntR family)